MKRLFSAIMFFMLSLPSCYGFTFHNDIRCVKSVLNSQVKYANQENFSKFISTYDKDYKNYDGFNLDTYSKLVQEIWKNYNKIKYGIQIKDIAISGDTAVVKLVETSSADIPSIHAVSGILKSEANSTYYLKKTNGKWKVISDKVDSETTSMLYGEAKDLNIKLTAPNEIPKNTEYTAALEFTVPENTLAIASISNDKIEYPQKEPQEVFRKMPDDNLLERFFTSNSENKNEYVIASIGLTRADIKDLSIKISLTGFGYHIVRVNVTPDKKDENNVETK